MKQASNNEDKVKEITDVLRRRIVLWKYPPNFPLVEENLANEFSVSRSPIRMALTYLAAERLVERLPRRGFRVRQLQLNDVEELYEFRLALEMQVIQGVAHKGIPQDILFDMQTTWQDLDTLAKKSLAEMAELDEAFHTTFAKIYGNKLILSHLESINERLIVFRELDFHHNTRIDQTSQEHCEILHAIVSRNAALASDLLKRNIYSGLGNVENSIVRLVGNAYLHNSDFSGGNS